MSIIEVAIPMMRGRRRFHVESGRRWSVIEHLMLEAVSRAPATTAELSNSSKLHRRIVVEAFIRLMRAGWVEIIDNPKTTIFRATDMGKEQIRIGELKGLTTIRPRPMSFAFDRVTGQAFRGSEFSIRARHRIKKSADADALIFLSPDPRKDAEDLSQIYSALEGDNEVIVGSDPSPYLPIEGFAVVRVMGGAIDNISTRAEAPLRRAILRAAEAASKHDHPTSVNGSPKPIETDWAEPVVDAIFDQNDLLLGGADHRAAFLNALSHAREHVVIHSTFISENQDEFIKAILAAAARNVRVDVLWGQSDDLNENSSSRSAASQLRRAMQEAGRGDIVKVHTLTTDSHAKILASDDGSGAWLAYVGSCNWLSTDFQSFEATVRLRDQRLAGRIMIHLAAMSLGARGVWHGLADELTVLGRRISTARQPSGRRAKVRILLSPDHACLPLEARDHAKRRITITSHRIGVAGLPMAIVPMVTAAQERAKLETSLFYGRATGPLSGVDTAELSRQVQRQGVRIRPIFRPRLHAKVLCWDDDSIAVSSQNWLSASSSQGTPRREIGVFVEMNKIADTFLRRFDHASSAF